MKRFLVVLTLATGLLAGGASHAATKAKPDAGCPSASRCKLYALNSERWTTRYGIATIHFRINTTQPWLLPGDVVAAVEAAADEWEQADPAVDFVYDGTTTELPQLGNAVNEIAWIPTMEPDVIAETNHRAKGARRVEADTFLNITQPWSWSPCDGASARCGDADGTGLRTLDLQAVVTQQLGHWLSLASLDAAAAKELTMFSSIGYGERHQSTLGLGDILGVRAAYPCRRCRSVPVSTP